MGIQMMGSHRNGHQSHHFQSSPRQNSWFALTLDQVQNHLGNLGKPLGSMSLEELLKSLWAVEESHQHTGMDIEGVGPASSLMRQTNLNLARAFSGKTVDEVWKDIQRSQKVRHVEGFNIQEREQSLGETTLKDFFVKAGIFVADSSIENVMVPDNALTPQNFTPQLGLSSPSTSVDALLDTSVPGRKRGPVDFEKTLERKLRRKIKNRESAARSRARKQAYHNELVNKVSHLEMENMKLKKEKELDKLLSTPFSTEPRYQLRRTSSF